ncbi:MAG TPA: nucleoside diphosphate kinase regulator [Sphingomicrobium sp.]|nr:nucleoside diphosphate kinase regulator [Sphingomicrobium sp.]
MSEIFSAGAERPPLHMLAAESDMVASLALQAEHRHPVVAAMLLEEIERAELHEPGTLPEEIVTLNSEIEFVDEKSCQLRTVQLVLPAEANISEGKISILTPVGAALYGLMAGQAIDWPDLSGDVRRIRILRVRRPGQTESAMRN